MRRYIRSIRRFRAARSARVAAAPLAAAALAAALLGTSSPHALRSHPARVLLSAPVAHHLLLTSTEQGYVPPNNPPESIPPNPPLVGPCPFSGYNDSTTCVNDSVQAIDNARAQEGLPEIQLPSNWYQLTPAEQLLVTVNLERTARGLPPFLGLNSTLDQGAAQGAENGTDPTLPSGFPSDAWASNWAGGLSNPLEADYYWMYDDGPNSPNIDCKSAGDPGCWGHRDNILWDCEQYTQYCIMGADFEQGNASASEIFVAANSPQPLYFTWASEEGDFSSPPVPPSGSGSGNGSNNETSNPSPSNSNPSPSPSNSNPSPSPSPSNSNPSPSTPPPEANLFTALGVPPQGGGLWAVQGNGSLTVVGNVSEQGSLTNNGTTPPATVIAVVPTSNGQGYWEVAADGEVFPFGNAQFYGDLPTLPSSEQPPPGVKVVALVPTPDDQGYWEVTSAGDVYSFGDAQFYGSTGLMDLAAPIVAAAATPSGQGYWLFGADGGVFTFGDAQFHGNPYTAGLTGLSGSRPLAAPIVAAAATPSGQGYWLFGADGGVFAFGNAEFFGSTYSVGITGLSGAHPLAAPIMSAGVTQNGQGYWLLGADGGVFAFGDAPFYGRA